MSLDCDIYITGSNAKLLSGELSTYLGGRFVEFVIYLFSFTEFLELYRLVAPDEPIQRCFQKYLLSGGMPYLANIRYEDAPSKLYLHDLFNSVQLKDIVKRNKIRDVDLLERIIAYVIANVGTAFSATCRESRSLHPMRPSGVSSGRMASLFGLFYTAACKDMEVPLFRKVWIPQTLAYILRDWQEKN